ncbi:nucleotidyltransferase domain-containing protein [Microbacter margulisiae]|uniref:DNA polymerase sigma n=1 Tax=Microbacter margulisiae TaxID=1350067 RepID=A0A7W5H2B0_9PORP|nr:nucleotidyltransferase domain-containing protein [Microbacter margulisiae]MBB3187232.1 DNA polymerase sigma [Microbacter margulisiae]
MQVDTKLALSCIAMRLNNHIISFLKQIFGEKAPDARLFLFGSRTQDQALGGDIDLMILTSKPIDKKIFRDIRIAFYKQYGWQKIDFVNFTHNDASVFRQLIEPNAIEL